MSLVCRGIALIGAVIGAATVALSASARPPLRVCADPNNMPVSNQAREGFENKIRRARGA
jgi:mxaJ protein